MTKEICKIARNVLRLALSGPLQQYRRRRKRRFSENNCCVQGRRWEQIIAKHIALAAKRSSFAKCGDSLRELEETAYWFELLLEGGIVLPEKLAALRQECDELIAIFVTM